MRLIVFILCLIFAFTIFLSAFLQAPLVLGRAIPGFPNAQGYCFPVGGKHSYSNDWHAPRYIPTFHLHKGTDIIAPRWTPVYACVDGVVKKTEVTKVGGKIIGLLGKDSYYYYYAHLEAFAVGLEPGFKIKSGQIIGYVGNSGNAQGGPTHLHFGIKVGGEWVNPYPMLKSWEGS